MQVIHRQKFLAQVQQDPQLADMLVDFLETLPRALSLRGGSISTPQSRLQHYLEAEGLAVNVPVPGDVHEPAFTPRRAVAVDDE